MAVNKLTSDLKKKLIQQSLQRQMKKVDADTKKPIRSLGQAEIPEKFYRFDQHPGCIQMNIMNKGAEQLGVESPFFRVHEGVAGALSVIDGNEIINFASYNYLGLTGHPKVNKAAKKAVDQYGTSVSASRIVSGERPVHQQLEQALADFYDVDDAVVFVSGHATNVSTIGYLFGPKDLIIHDEFIHNSSIVGSQLSGAKRLSFSHNDMASLEQLLKDNRQQFERVLIIVEGLYSMDGDFPDLIKLVELKKRYKTFLMVDEAHSFGVLGDTGKGLREEFNVASTDVDIWMGTLSKTLSGCGGYIAGESALVENLRHLAPGFLYSVGIPAPVAAAATASLEIIKAEPERIQKLHQISEYFITSAQQLGLDIGKSQGTAIIPVILGSSLKAASISSELFKQGINVQPILYPAVPEKSARLRFFLCCDHTEQQVDQTLELLSKLI
ncbi:aminotransferase class I/II-fold pyridoxal phosphate-dependent enzyme [Amphritea balenae]|uniref:Aminotransferase class I/II-fold pyridoxal phosphate-dependent enzyme n=1 Tax=Amphritea balenae TaxID=452629 RepID=A0A3P1SVU0_9GAMM|nr:aminotransferase class I/II-fold pyridoxal phosphate-dependent enzyme [Amphritea balenae]RRD01309.1 aminotransferase class I/II-fold pyridoxal phosphate-dependent enzyme [Amphritea balenae]GGK58286.1 polyketide synthase [Amphritea balenae]